MAVALRPMVALQRAAAAATRGRVVAARGLTSEMNAPVGFIGLGNMGGHMARNLLKAGRTVTVFDVAPEATQALATEGAAVADSPGEAAAGAGVVITMVPSNPHVREVYTAPDGVFSKMAPGTLCIDSSTVDPAVSIEMAAAAKEAGGSFMDAPVSGGVGAAEAGTLSFMVGAEHDDFETAKPLLEIMGANIFHCGGVGHGEVVKICNNLMLGISMIGASEMMNLGVRLGVDPKLLASIVNVSTGRSWSTEVYNPCPGVVETAPASRGYTGGFGATLILKDLNLAIDAAEASATKLPLGVAAANLYSDIVEKGLGENDFSVAYPYLAGKDPKEE
mmetsp:Transcript_22582/g.58974  ORF Transcript_22582/g.58974 Transcript_22582/m.58974 type:complete len:334 (+) Transcript_22582:44-1045(+)